MTEIAALRRPCAPPPALLTPRVLVLGYGNPGRQDDGLGPAAAAAIQALEWPGVTVRDNYQLVVEDADYMATHDVVWFVDASRDGAEPYAVQRVAPRADSAFSSHLLTPGTLLAMVHQYYACSPTAYLLGIRGYAFAFREGLSARAAGNLGDAVALLRARIGALLEATP